jgi:hypothetical protein
VRHVLLALVAVTAMHARANAGACARNVPLTPHVLNQAAARSGLPAGGGLVFASLPDNNIAGGAAPPELGADVTWLAPGLAVQRSAPDKADKPTKPPPLVAAPVVRAVRFSPAMGMHGIMSLVAELARKPPAGVLALVVLDAGKARTPRSWGLVRDPSEIGLEPESDGMQIIVFSGGGRCVEMIRDLIASNVGDRVVLAWVDAYGRLSKPSSPITVAKARP